MEMMDGESRQDGRQDGKGRKGIVRRWLEPYPWQQVVGTLAAFWHLPAERFETAHETRDLWESEAGREMRLEEALRVCRRCQTAQPFGQYDCESFVIIAREIVKPLLDGMSTVLSAAVSTIVEDYVRGVGDDLEFSQTLQLVLEKYEDV
jgi:hypothetical protein